ncbi:uncharacterized protein [Watersipora subatra]|uniref:uncharacterized protein n=1 Tax=Watersipora subatra TaxID=2589382 RepID=UPI00355BF62D
MNDSPKPKGYQDQALNLVTTQSLRRPFSLASKCPSVVDACAEPDSSSASSPKKSMLESIIKGNSVKLTIEGHHLIFPFRPTDNVSTLTAAIKEATGQECQVLDTDGAIYTSKVTLADVRIPFEIHAGNSCTLITDNEKDVRTVGHTVCSSLANETGGENAVSHEDDKAIQFGRVATATQAVQLLSFVHKHVASGKSINSALKMARKDRKTIDRFQHIYYLHHLNSGKLKQVEEEWRSKDKPGGLQGLDALSAKELNWIELNNLADESVLTLFSVRKGNV